jgi:hypothetical protein
MLSTGLITPIRNTGNKTPLRGGTFAKKQAAFRFIFSVYTSLSSSYSVQAFPFRLRNCRPLNLTTEFRPDALGCALLLSRNLLSPCAVERKWDLLLLQPFIDAAYSVLPQPQRPRTFDVRPRFHRSFERRILGPHEAEENYFVC